MKYIEQTEEYWKSKLTPEQYEVLRLKGTEAPFTGKYVDNHQPGMYACAACGKPLFSSETKFESHSGWPSFYDTVTKGNVELHEDNAHGMKRIEVTCANCGSHLGHLFDDGPADSSMDSRFDHPELTVEGESPRAKSRGDKTGQRYCINSSALNFKQKK